MRGRLVDARWIESRMRTKDARFERALRRRQPSAFLAPEIVPVVDVEVIRVPVQDGPVVVEVRIVSTADAVGPVVEVGLEPVGDGAK